MVWISIVLSVLAPFEAPDDFKEMFIILSAVSQTPLMMCYLWPLWQCLWQRNAESALSETPLTWLQWCPRHRWYSFSGVRDTASVVSETPLIWLQWCPRHRWYCVSGFRDTLIWEALTTQKSGVSETSNDISAVSQTPLIRVLVSLRIWNWSQNKF